MVLLGLAFLPFYFDLTFPVFFHSSVLMHPEHYTDLDNLDTVETNLRHSAKGSTDAYDVTISLTLLGSLGSASPSQVMSPTTRSSTSSSTPRGSFLLRYPVIGPGHRRHYARQAAHRCTPRIRRLPQSGRCVVGQSSLSVVFDRTGKPVGRKKYRSVNWFWCHEKHVQCSQQVF